MIKYTLRCAEGHSFESWFANGAAFEGLLSAGHVTCAACGSTDVRKDIMAPRIASGAARAPETAQAGEEGTGAVVTGAGKGAPAPPDLKALREKIERESDYIGGAFAKEARAMHQGTAPHRSIYGEARPEEARALLKDGVPVLPLPFIPTKKAH